MDLKKVIFKIKNKLASVNNFIMERSANAKNEIAKSLIAVMGLKETIKSKFASANSLIVSTNFNIKNKVINPAMFYIKNYIYWIIVGKELKTKEPSEIFKDAYFIHAYKIRKETEIYGGGLNTSSNLTVEALRHYGFKAESVGFNDDNELDAVLFKERPSHLIVKAFWVRKEKLELLAKKYPSCKFIIVCHSKASFLANENNGFSKLNDVIDLSKKLKNVSLATNNYDMSSACSKVYNKDVLFLPNLTIFDERKGKPYNFCDKTLRVGIFCAVRPMKNMLNQIMAAIKYCEENKIGLELHVLSERMEMGGEKTIKNIRDLFSALDSKNYKLVEHKWYKHKDFLRLIRLMDIGLQSSFTESFNIVAIDFLRCSIPIVTSPAISWSPKQWQANPDDIEDIKNKIKMWITASNCRKNVLFKKGENNLKKYNKQASKVYYNLSKEAKKW